MNGRWTLDLPDHRQAQWANPWEPERLTSMCDLLTGNDTLYDIGSEEATCPLAASWGCRVVMVEPDPRVWPNIRTCFTANDLESKVAGVFVGFAGSTDRYENGPSEVGARVPDRPEIRVRWTSWTITGS